mgnify:CR=1 FL=1
MKLSFTKVIGAIALCLGLLLTTQVLAQQNQSSPLTNDEAISILQKAPGGSNLNFASSDHRWQSRTSEMTTGDAFIWAIAIEGTKVYVGGEFSSINGIPMNNVGVYDLESQIWSPITAVINSESINGVPGRVYAIDTIDDDVIIAGSFNFIHPIDGSLNGIVRYNTSSQYFYGFKTGNDTQYGVGGGFIYTIKAALMPGKTANFSNGGPNYVVLVGGSFTTAGGEAAPYLAYFDFNGDGWQPIYHLLQFDDSVYDVMIDGMTLIVAGQFTNVNSVPGTAGIVVLSLTDDNIISVGGGITEGFRVHSIEKIGNELYIGGFFSRVGDVPVNNFARFDMYSNQWSALNTNFNGTVDVTVYDKPMNVKTLGNDGATPFEFSHFVNILFKGKASVVNGEFSTEFVVPHDIRYNFARGKVSYYAHSPQYGEAFGAFRDIVVGGFDVNALPDNDGPEVNLYLNHPSFKPGDVTGASPMLYANVFDPSGINTSGSGIGHDIILIINGNRNEPIVLNGYFQSKPDTYKEGQIVFQLPMLPAGSHQLTLRVWDTHNNSTIVETHFVVGTGSDLKISNFTWSPNPISGQATGYFAFDLEEPNAALIITAEALDMNGATTGKQILRTVAQNNRVYPMPLSMPHLGVSRPGIYFIRFQIRTETGKESQVVEKLLVRP